MPEKKDNNLEEAFSDTVDGFADLFHEVEMNDVGNVAGLSLSTQPVGKYNIVGKVDEGGMKQILEIEDQDGFYEYCEDDSIGCELEFRVTHVDADELRITLKNEYWDDDYPYVFELEDLGEID